MAEELANLRSRSNRNFGNKTIQTDPSLEDHFNRSMQIELEELERELDSSYEHIQILEQRNGDSDFIEKEANYLQEKVETVLDPPLKCF